MSGAYLDACSIIYLIEAANPFHGKIKSRLSLALGREPPQLVTSRLACLECRVRPLKQNDLATLAAYDAFFDAAGLTVVEITGPVIERATRLRAFHGFAAADAIHLATAIEQRVDTFLTGDGALMRCPGLTVEVLTPA